MELNKMMICSDDLNIVEDSKITFREVIIAKNPLIMHVKKWDILYNDNNKRQNIFLYIKYKKNDVESGVFSLGIKTNDKNFIENNKKTIPLLIDQNNTSQINLIKGIKKISKICEEFTKCKDIKIPLKEYNINGETIYSIECKILDTKIYDIYGNTIKAEELEKFEKLLIRPGIIFSLINTKKNGYILNCYLNELCVIEKK